MEQLDSVWDSTRRNSHLTQAKHLRLEPSRVPPTEIATKCVGKRSLNSVIRAFELLVRRKIGCRAYRRDSFSPAPSS